MKNIKPIGRPHTCPFVECDEETCFGCPVRLAYLRELMGDDYEEEEEEV